MSNKSEFDPNATPWRPKGFKNLNSAGRSELRAQKTAILAKQSLAREKAKEARNVAKSQLSGLETETEGRSRVDVTVDEAATIPATEKA